MLTVLSDFSLNVTLIQINFMHDNILAYTCIYDLYISIPF